MNKVLIQFIFFIFLFPASSKLVAQPMQYTVWSTNYMFLDSYLGYTSANDFTKVQFSLGDRSYIQPEWSLSVRLLGPIRLEEGSNRIGKPFPADKISLKWTGTAGDNLMRLEEIGATLEALTLPESGELFLVSRSRQPIQSFGRNSALHLLLNQMRIAPGKYLENYLSTSQWNHVKYNFNLLYTLYDSQNRVLGTQVVPYTFQMPPQLKDGHLVDVEPDYNIAVSSDMQEVNLSFKNIIDYKQGVQVHVPSGITVNTKTDYELRVKALDSDIRSAIGNSLPLNIIKVSIKGEGSTTGTSSAVQLSTTEQIAFRGTSKDKNIKRPMGVYYEVNIPAENLKKVVMGTYSVSLMYQLLPL